MIKTVVKWWTMEFTHGGAGRDSLIEKKLLNVPLDSCLRRGVGTSVLVLGGNLWIFNFLFYSIFFFWHFHLYQTWITDNPLLLCPSFKEIYCIIKRARKNWIACGAFSGITIQMDWTTKESELVAYSSPIRCKWSPLRVHQPNISFIES